MERYEFRRHVAEHGHFDSGGIRKHFRENPVCLRFQFSFPPNHDYSFEFLPIKTALRPQGTTAILRVYDLHFRFYVNRSNAILLLRPPHKKGNNYKSINNPNDTLRYDDRYKTESWVLFILVFLCVTPVSSVGKRVDSSN